MSESELPPLDDTTEATATLCDTGPDDEWVEWEAHRGDALASAQDKIAPSNPDGGGQ